MTLTPKLRRVFLVVALLLLLGLTWTGLNGGVSLLLPSQSPGQKVQAVAQIAFGLFALMSAVTTVWGRRWWPFALAGFALTFSLAAGLFAVVWNRTTVIMGIVTGVMALLASLAIIWLLRAGAR